MPPLGIPVASNTAMSLGPALLLSQLQHQFSIDLFKKAHRETPPCLHGAPPPVYLYIIRVRPIAISHHRRNHTWHTVIAQ